MRHLLVGLTLLIAIADRTSDRDALLVADRALSDKTGAAGGMQGFVPVLTDDAVYLYPGAPLLRGIDRIRSYVASNDSIIWPTWSPAFADVSADGRFGYSYGWTRFGAARGKYLACWKKVDGGWRLAAYAMTRPVPDTTTPRAPRGELGAQISGRADPVEVSRADSTFAALSVRSGAKAAFLAYAAENAISFGGGVQFTDGRAAIGAAFDNFPAGAVLEWQPLAAEIAPSGDLGCTVGEARISSFKHYSKYLTIWRRQADGGWKFVADGGNTRPAPGATDSRPPED
jgi:ketosteroid isomerase-like protein